MKANDKNIIDSILFLRIKNNELIRIDKPHKRSRKVVRDFYKKNGYWIPKKYKTKNGYTTIHLKNKPVFLHRILAILNIPNPNNHPYVNHIDGNKLNNSLSNLEWCTQSQNTKHSYDIIKTQSYERLKNIGKIGTKIRIKLNRDLSECIYNEYINTKTSYRKLAKKYNLGKTTIERVVTGKGQVYFANKIKKEYPVE